MGDSLDELPPPSMPVLSNPINPNLDPTSDITGISIQVPLNTSEPQKKMSPNPRALGPVKFAKSQEVELLWLETVKVSLSIAQERFIFPPHFQYRNCNNPTGLRGC